MIKYSLSGMRRSRDGPLKKVAKPRSTAEQISVKRLAIHLGNHCTIIIDGMYVSGMIVNISPTSNTDRPNSSSLGEKVGSSCVSWKYERAPQRHANTSLGSLIRSQFEIL